MRTSYYELSDQSFKRMVNNLKNHTESISNVSKSHVYVSPGNSKLGAIPSVSLLPVIDCGNCSHCAKSCYDLRHDVINKNCAKTRSINSLICATDQERYFREIDAWITYNSPRAFRWHIGGDIRGAEYLAGMVRIAEIHKDIKFLCFTKMFHVVNKFIDDGGIIPQNLKIIFSGWIGQEMSNPYNFPSAHPLFSDGTTSAKDGAKLCTGNCTECFSEKRLCWELKSGEEVVFNAH